MYKILILEDAKLDISNSTNWYESKQKGLGKRFIKEVRTKVQIIQKNPKLFAIRYDEIRCLVLNDFPFMIHYTIDEFKKTIIIVAVFHTSLNPIIWGKR